MIAHFEKKEEIIKQLETDSVNGLSSNQAAAKLEQYGKNKLREPKKKSIAQRFLDQFKDVMIIILIIAAIISFIVALYEKEAKEFLEPVLIMLIVILNAIMGVLQESKAEKALEALKGVKVWIVDACCYPYEPYDSMPHASKENLLKWVEILKPEITYFTVLNTKMDYQKLCSELPSYIRPAYDGLVIEI